MPKISVVVPVYKVEAYLDQCVQSLLKQTFQDFELLLVDDGSPDRCGEMCDGYAAQDSRIRVIHQSNAGLSCARNAGIRQAQGDYITFVDSDDWVTEDYLSYLLSGVEEHGADISVGSFCSVYGGKAVPWRTPDDAFAVLSAVEAVENMFYAESFDTSAWAKLFPRSCFQEKLFPPGLLYEEVATTYRLLLTQQKVAVGRRPIYFYRKRSDSIVGSRFSPQSMDMLVNTQELFRYVQANVPQLQRAAVRRLVYACFYLLKTLSADYPSYPRETDELVAIVKKHAKSVLLDKRAPKRDKTAILLLYLGKAVFVRAWRLYCACTGRNVRS